MEYRNLASSFGVLLGCLALGELASWGLALPVPGNVIGMVILASALVLGAIDVEVVESAASLMLSNLGILFVPPAVGVMLYFDLIAAEWLPLFAGTFVSILAVLWSTAFVAHLFEKGEE